MMPGTIMMGSHACGVAQGCQPAIICMSLSDEFRDSRRRAAPSHNVDARQIPTKRPRATPPSCPCGPEIFGPLCQIMFSFFRFAKGFVPPGHFEGPPPTPQRGGDVSAIPEQYRRRM